MNEYEIIKFKNDDIELSVNVSPSEDTVWLTKEQMAILFNRDRSVISGHIKNIYDEGELNKSTSVHFLHISNNNPKNRPPELYNLDVIISVGYRVKSQNGIIFGKWANKILLVDPYADSKALNILKKYVNCFLPLKQFVVLPNVSTSFGNKKRITT